MIRPHRMTVTPSRVADLEQLADTARQHLDEAADQQLSEAACYAMGVLDVLSWLAGGEPSPQLSGVLS